MLNSVAHTEWSGILFYKYAGSVKDISKMSFELVGLYPLDVGSSAYTEYKMASHMNDVMKLYDEHPEYEDCKVGHIHSHHSMGVFASSTDMDTLLNCVANKQFDMLLSVIVNNARDMFAGVAFQTQVVTRGVRMQKVLFNGEESMVETAYERTTEGVAWTKCACNVSRLTSVRNPMSHIVSKLAGLLFNKPLHTSRTTAYPGSQFPTGRTITIDTGASDEELQKELREFTASRNKPFIVDQANTAQNKLTDEETAYLIIDNLYDIELNDYSAQGLFSAIRKHRHYKFDVPLEEYSFCIESLYPESDNVVASKYDAAKLISKTLGSIKNVPNDCRGKFNQLRTDIENIEATYYDYIKKS